jgi:RNA polymerase sigma factor (sigma-70 family)
MKRFGEFFNETFLFLEDIEYTDKTLFTRIINEDITPSEDELTNFDIELSNPDSASKYLNNDEELRLIKIYKDDPTSQEGIEARNTVVENKLKFIHLLAHKAVRSGRIKDSQRTDAVQNAVISLMHAIDKFDPEKGVPFTAYAKQWIMAGITNPFNPVRQRSISSDAIGKDSLLSLTSIDEPINDGSSDDKTMSAGEKIADNREGINPYEDLEYKDLMATLHVFLKKLSAKEAKAIKLRFSTKPDGSERTFEEIGQELGMTKMGAKLLIDRTLAKLKNFAKEEKLQFN